MTRRLSKSLLSGLAMGGLLASLALAAPTINATSAPARSVFHHLPDTEPEPQLDIAAKQGEDGRWILALTTAYFQFTEICLFDADAIPMGHAHIVANGVKVASAYHPVADLGALPPGQHRITVILRGQDHRALVGQQGLIMDEIVINVPSVPAAR